jgi:hypothetical protein
LPTPDNNRETELFSEGEEIALEELAREEEVLVIEEDVLTPDVVRSEVNFLAFPFFALWDKDVKKRTKVEYKAVIKREGQRLEILWMVSSNSEFGYPGPFDKNVHKAIEQIINELPRPIQNPIPLGAFCNLCQRMGFNTFGGWQYEKIKKALERIIATTVKSKGAFYSKEKRKWIEDTFHLYERLVSKGEELANGEIADTNYLYLNSWYLDNVNANYVKPLDWKYYNSLKTPLAQRLYELLSIKFYGVIMRRGLKLSYRYSTLCGLLPVRRQKYLSDAKKLLDPAHEKLKETGFLADYKWGETSPQSKRDWLIIYYPGRRAREEIKEAITGFKSPQLEVEYLPAFPSEAGKPEPEPELEEELEPLPLSSEPAKEQKELTEEQVELVEKLVQLNVTKSVAYDLVRHFDNQFIRKWTEAIHYADARDKAAYLVDAVRGDWLLPEKWLKIKEQEAKKAEMEKLKQLEEERQQKEARKRKEEAERLENIYNSLPVDQKEEVDKEAYSRLSFIAREWIREGRSDSPIVQADRKTKKEDVLKEWLKDGKIKVE